MDIKLKMLYLSEHKYKELKNKKNNIQIFLKIIFSLSFKTVMSSKGYNRILKNYFKICSENSETEYKNNLRTNKTTMDRNYNSGLSLNNLYEVVSKLLYVKKI
jgi:hypothetical protein